MDSSPTGEHVVAARVSGDATSAFADGPPAGVPAPAGAFKASAKPINVVVFADTDLLSDFMWVQHANFFGQTMSQPFANNGELVWNALDNLAGSTDLISIRGRASYSRPFERVDALRRDADSQFRSTELQLETELNQTEENLTKLQSAQPGGSEAMLSVDQAREIERFQDEKLRIRKELRAVKSGLELRHQVARDVDQVHQHPGGAAVVRRRGDAGRAVASPPSSCHRHAAQGSRGMMRIRSRALAGATAVLLIAGLWLSLHRSSQQR